MAGKMFVFRNSSAPMSDVGVSILIGMYVLSFTAIVIGADHFYKLIAIVPLMLNLALWTYLFSSAGEGPTQPKASVN